MLAEPVTVTVKNSDESRDGALIVTVAALACVAPDAHVVIEVLLMLSGLAAFVAVVVALAVQLLSH